MASSTHYIRPIIRTYCDPRLEELDLEIDGLTDAELIEAKRKAAVERERRLYLSLIHISEPTRPY